jgi:uracil-DNA glycosylase family protein
MAKRIIGRPTVRGLAKLAEAENVCGRCPLYQDATQAVPGEGRRDARVMLVGEQPGDKEDLAGKPFIGPAGRVLDSALADAGIPRDEAFVTNAVKHFKFEPRGKRRLHKKPNANEIESCRWWLEQERAIVNPDVIVALGATAARSLIGKVVTIAKLRGAKMHLGGGTRLVVTIHPSALLRIQDETKKRSGYAAFVRDLKLVARLAFMHTVKAGN